MTDVPVDGERIAYLAAGDQPAVSDAAAETEAGPPEDELEAQWPEENVELDGEPSTTSEIIGDTAEVPVAWAISVCSIALAGETPAARVLRRSLTNQHPDTRFILLSLDPAVSDEDAADPAGEVLRPADIGISDGELNRLATACTAEELRAVLRPRLLAHLLRAGYPVLYLDPWVYVVGPLLDRVVPAVHERPLVLAPRVLEPLPRDGLRPAAEELASDGTFDTGLVAVAPGAEDFLHSWAQQARLAPYGAGFLDGAPALVDHRVLRDAGVGLSSWNAAQRALWRAEDGLLMIAEGIPLRTVHFDGFDPQRPWLFSTRVSDRPRVLLSEHPELAGLCAAYLKELGKSTAAAPAPGSPASSGSRLDVLPDGVVLPLELRRDFHGGWMASERADVDPPPAAFAVFGDDQITQARSFLTWAGEPGDPAQQRAGGNRWVAAVWRGDSALHQEFPDPFGADAEGFRAWCAGPGLSSGRVHPEVVPSVPEFAGVELLDQLGVSVLGDHPVADLLRSAVEASGLPSAAEPIYPVVLDCTGHTLSMPDRQLVQVCVDGAAVSTSAAELWVLSETTRSRMPHAGRPVRVLPLPVPEVGQIDLPARKAARARLGLDDGMVFAALVDHADERRDNALGLVGTFLAAFPDRPEVRLVLRVSGAREHQEGAERLRLATAADRRVVLLDASKVDRDGLIDAADCIVSLHREAESVTGGDDVALWLLRAVARGVPVLASDHGSAADLLGDDLAALVPCFEGRSEPDMRSAAEILRRFADAPESVADLGSAAREHALAARNANWAAQQVRGLVEVAYRGWRQARAQLRPAEDDPLKPLVAARHALHRAPEVGSQGGRMPLAPALQRAMLKALSHYDGHLREVMRSLIDGVERTAAELLRRQEESAGGIEPMELDALRAEIARIDRQRGQLAEHLVGTDDAVVRARSDLGGQQRRLRAVEEAATAESATRVRQVDLVAERLDRLTAALDKTLDRIDSLESRVADALRERDGALASRLHDVERTARTADALRRVVVREHERQVGVPDGPPSSLVLSDAGLIRLPAEDGVMLPWLSTHGVWEPEFSTLIDSLLEPDGVFLDIGAHVGYQTVRVLSRLGSRGAVVAVEPCEKTAALLRRNVAVNVSPAAAGRLTVVAAAAWDEPGSVPAEPAAGGGLRINPQPNVDLFSDANTAEVQQPPGGGPEAPAEQSTVEAVRLDRHLDGLTELQGLRISVVRVDTPGCTQRALGGLIRLLRRDRPHIVCTFSPAMTRRAGTEPSAVLNEFQSWGYEIALADTGEVVSVADVVRTAPDGGARLWLRPSVEREA
ncbi:FkbM family methyltransferase [Actinoalloteichus hymeniacidonis]|uniref:Methyltransferase, FkbM family n=1 Tax=Actinoalloteichus hymeniacidonis TaxID=340345 RepID=A0AAC9HTG8_9PSEU|nr:FkbM family methyltransferase [Actinoalloteichus hymeniacidonis]AOS65178.1 methyltransferase, FkbM family [Actinoalloteichus hymeniacidonis]MBB5906742.1 FkbM family methyltransferase [Actinoalloteichus hymeniacidonis]